MLPCSARTATRPKRKPQATQEETAAELDAHNRNRISVSRTGCACMGRPWAGWLSCLCAAQCNSTGL